MSIVIVVFIIILNKLERKHFSIIIIKSWIIWFGVSYGNVIYGNELYNLVYLMGMLSDNEHYEIILLARAWQIDLKMFTLLMWIQHHVHLFHKVFKNLSITIILQIEAVCAFDSVQRAVLHGTLNTFIRRFIQIYHKLNHIKAL
jgi:hypothetical protein